MEVDEDLYDDYEDEEEETCPEGYSMNECCCCITKFGIETCEFSCPFGGPPRCGEEQAKKCREDLRKQEQKRITDFEKQKLKQKYRIDETLELDFKKNHPFRDSLGDIARCGMCQNSKKQMTIPIKCKKGHELRGPYITRKHDCKDYEYEPHYIEKIPNDKIRHFMGIETRRPECHYCGHQLYGYCSGLKWYPAKLKNDICEFFWPDDLTCKHAIPCFQYGTTIRNNYCKLDPSKRNQPDNKSNSWEWMCPWAHEESANHLKCYEPRTEGEHA